MPEYSEKKKAYNIRYQREKMKRIPLDVQLPEYDRLKTYCNDHGYTINGFIKKLISDAIGKE